MSILSDIIKANRKSNVLKMEEGTTKKLVNLPEGADREVQIGQATGSADNITSAAKAQTNAETKVNNGIASEGDNGNVNTRPVVRPNNNPIPHGPEITQPTISPITKSYDGLIGKMQLTGSTDEDEENFKKALKKAQRRENFNNFAKNRGFDIIGTGTDLASQLVDVDEDSGFNTQQKIGDALLKSGNPYAMLAGAAVKVASIGSQALGINQNTISKDLANWADVGNGARALNNINAVLDVGGLTGLITKKTTEFDKAEELDKYAGAASGTMSNINMASQFGGKRYAIGGNKINEKILEAIEQQNRILDADAVNTNRLRSTYGTNLAQRNIDRFAGNDYSSVSVGKNGMKLNNINDARYILLMDKISKEAGNSWDDFIDNMTSKNIPEFKEGGKLNILPDGALHANLNHIDESDSKLDVEITKKGIPIVTKTENGIEQCAEIERQELILNYDLTKFIEDKLKLYNETDNEDAKRKLALEVGIKLSDSIVKDTQDEAKFMNTIKI